MVSDRSNIIITDDVLNMLTIQFLHAEIEITRIFAEDILACSIRIGKLDYNMMP